MEYLEHVKKKCISLPIKKKLILIILITVYEHSTNKFMTSKNICFKNIYEKTLILKVKINIQFISISAHFSTE